MLFLWFFAGCHPCQEHRSAPRFVYWFEVVGLPPLECTLQPEKHSPSKAWRLPQLILKGLDAVSQSNKRTAIKDIVTQILKTYVSSIYRKQIILEASDLSSQFVREPLLACQSWFQCRPNHF